MISNKIIKKIVTCIAYALISFCLFHLLTLCLKVRSFRHFVFISHSISTNGANDNIKASVSFSMSNTDIDYGTSYKFSPKSVVRRSKVLLPQFHSTKYMSLLTGLSISQLDGYARQSNIPLDSITELYTVVNIETARDTSVSYEECINPSVDGIRLHRTFLMGDDGLRVTHANIIERVLDETINQFNKYGRNRIFQYDNQRFLNSSFYALAPKGKDVNIGDSEKEPNGFRWIFKLFQPHDITREEHCFVFHSEAIDTLSLTLKFDEKVDISPLNRESSYESYQEIKFNDITTLGDAKYEVESKYLYDSVKPNSVNIRIGYYQQKSVTDNISFWVKYMSSEKLQWFRLFAITTLLGLSLTEFVLSIFGVIKEVIVSRKVI